MTALNKLFILFRTSFNHITYIFLFDLFSTSLLNISSDNDCLRGVNVNPTIENNLSTGAEEGIIVLYF